MHITTICKTTEVETLGTVNCFKCGNATPPDASGNVESVTISPESGDYIVAEGDSLMYGLSWSGDGVSYLEIDINIDSPSGGLDGRYQFTLLSDDQNPYGDDFEGLNALGVSVVYSGSDAGGEWVIDFGDHVTSLLIDSGDVSIYAELKDSEKKSLWGDMYNPSQDQVITLNVISQ